MAPRRVAIDFETWYTNEYSLKEMSTYAYVHDPRFNAYLVSVYGDGIQYVGHPKNFDWNTLRNKQLCMHNASFDGLVLRRLQQDGVIPADWKPELFDTADLVAFLRVKRNLANASKHLLGVDVDKRPRSKMKGKTWEEAKAAGMESEFSEYALNDSKMCLALAEKYADKWPEVEQQQSRINREAAWAGFSVDKDAIKNAYDLLSTKLCKALQDIPWAASADDKPLAAAKIMEQAFKDGALPCPACFAKDDPGVLEWEAKYADKFPWIRAVRDYRRINMFLQRVKLLRNEVRADGTVPYAAMYFGAATGRIQSGSGDNQRESGKTFNLFNMPRKAMFGVDIRSLIVPRPGKVLAVLDYSAIEAIVLLWRVGNRRLLDQFAAGMDLYEAYARQNLGWTGGPLKKENPELRQQGKIAVLSGGYGVAAAKLRATALVQYGVELGAEGSVKLVAKYRADNPEVVALWRQHQNSAYNSCIVKDETHIIELASGRDLVYWNPHLEPGGKWPDGRPKTDMVAEFMRGDNARKMYGGKLTENEIQATARDILRDAWVALEAAGIKVIFTVYDEVVCEVDESSAKDDLQSIQHIMENSSPWLTKPKLGTCPIKTDGQLMKVYTKG